MKIHNKVIDIDIPKAEKKHWYPGLKVEVRRVLKLLNMDKKLPGQYPMRGFRSGLEGTVQHARINLPKMNCGKSNGPRIVYIAKNGGTDYCTGNPEIVVLYVGGHKDKKYNNDEAIVSEIVIRLVDDDYTTYEDFLIKC